MWFSLQTVENKQRKNLLAVIRQVSPVPESFIYLLRCLQKLIFLIDTSETFDVNAPEDFGLSNLNELIKIVNEFWFKQ